MMKKQYRPVFTGLLICLFSAMLMLAGCSAGTVSGSGETEQTPAEEVELTDVSGGGWNYTFTCDGEEFSAQYSYDNWRVFDSYRITDENKMEVICQALIDTHPVHGSDYESYRTADDMVYEWQQHNLAYTYLPEDNPWRESAKNVDFDPEDQGRSFEEIYEDRTGQEFDLKEKIKEEMQDERLMERLEQYLNRD